MFGLIVVGTFILEDPTTLAVGTLIAKKEISFLFGFIALCIGIFLGDLGLYGLGYLIKKKIFKKKKSYYEPTTVQMAIARFLPGTRTLTFIASGYNQVSLQKFIFIIFPSSVLWTLFLITFSDQVYTMTHVLPAWGNWIVGFLILLFLAKMRLIVKFIGMVFLILTFIIHHTIFLSMAGRREKSLSLSRYCRIALKILNVELSSNINDETFSGKLVVSNHMSYLDVICLASIYPSIYVTSVEIKETPLLGLICRICGCQFTERRREKRNAMIVTDELNEMQKILNDGVCVTLFPEGTSTNGLKLLPFKTSFFQSSINIGANIQPLYLKYDEIDGENFSEHNSDIVCWYGDMSFFPHFLRLCNTKMIKAHVEVISEITARKYDDRKQLALACFQMIDQVRLREMSIL